LSTPSALSIGSGYKVIARQGEGRYILVPVGADDPTLMDARVLDTRSGVLHKPRRLITILAHGYWEDESMSHAELVKLLQGASLA
jgi:hypothetical protein